MTSSGLIGPLFVRRYPDVPSAADVVNTLDQQALASILFAYGEERRARRIAGAVVEARRAAPITGTRQLAAVVAGRFEPAGPGLDVRKYPSADFRADRQLGQTSRCCPGRLSSTPHPDNERARAAGNRTLLMSSSHASRFPSSPCLSPRQWARRFTR